MLLRKGTYVRHPKDEIHKLWGIGIVLEDEKSNQVSVFFENISRRKVIGSNFVSLLEVDDPGKSVVLLQNALYEDKGDRLPFPIVLEKFLIDFPDGMSGKLFRSTERDYKVEASQLSKQLLEKERMAGLIDQNDWQALGRDIKKVFSKSNLLASFESIKLSDALKTEESVLEVANIFFELLYGEANVSQRVESAGQKLAKFELDKWPIVTYLLFMVFPHNQMFIKPTMTKAAAENRGFDIQYESKINANTYKKVLLLAEDLFRRLNDDARVELHPADMIDIQSFMWCTYAGGWTDEDLKLAKERLEIKE